MFAKPWINFRSVMAGRMAVKPGSMKNRASFRIGSREIEPPNAGKTNRRGAHGAGLQRDPEIAFVKPRRSERGAR